MSSCDVRSSDWRFLVELDGHSRVLVLGVGAGVLPLALAETGAAVYVADDDKESLARLLARAAERELRNVHATAIVAGAFAAASVDLVAVDPACAPALAQLPEIVSFASGVLKEEGILQLSLPNRLALPGVFASQASARGGTLRSYRRVLRENGFPDCEAYMPLPYYDASPLFLLPVGHPGALRFFLDRLFPLLHAVSPEVKRRYRLPYALARAAVPLLSSLPMAWPIEHIVSGYLILAKRAHAGAR